MKKFVILAVAVLLCAGMVASADAQPTIRVGGGLIFDGTVWGGAIAADIPVSDEMPIVISPFFEYYKKSGVSTIPFGVNVLYSVRPMGDEGGTIYLGAGGGAIRISNGSSTTTYLIDAVGGATYPINESISLYGELKYMYASKETNNVKVVDLSDIGAAAGISFSLGSK